MSKARLLREVSSYEMTEWIALSVLEREEREKAEQEQKMRVGR